jgi:hypothetical protein
MEVHRVFEVTPTDKSFAARRRWVAEQVRVVPKG